MNACNSTSRLIGNASILVVLCTLSNCRLEAPLTPTSPTATLLSVVVACEQLPGPSPNAYCPAEACFSDRTTKFITPIADWGSSAPAVATVDRGGRVLYHSSGQAVISATFSWQNGEPVTGVHRMTITEGGCTASDPQRPLLCDGGSGGRPGFSPPGTCPY